MFYKKPYKCWHRTLNGKILNKLTFENLLKQPIVYKREDLDRYMVDILYRENGREIGANWTKLNVNMKKPRVKLQEMCRQNGMKTSGTKKDLIRRLMTL